MSAHRVEPPHESLDRLRREAADVGKPHPATPNLTRVDDVGKRQVDTFTRDARTHVTERYDPNPDGSLTKHYVKQHADGTVEQTRFDVGPAGSRKTTLYTRGDRQTLLRVEVRPDGSRFVFKQNAGGPAVCATYDAEGRTVPDSPVAACDPPDEPTRLARDRDAFHAFFASHPTRGDRNWYEAALRMLAESGNTYARQRLEAYLRATAPSP